MVRALRMVRLLPLVAAAALFASGCKSECRQLAEVLCTCSINSVDQSNCLQAAGTAGEPDGNAVLHVAWRHLGGLLGEPAQLTPGIRARTPCYEVLLFPFSLGLHLLH